MTTALGIAITLLIVAIVFIAGFAFGMDHEHFHWTEGRYAHGFYEAALRLCLIRENNKERL